MGLAGKNYPKGLMNDRGILYAPRLGIAYQIEPKTVMRAGGGVFYDRLQGNPVFDMLPNPPSTIIPKFYYGNLSAIPPASAGTFFPAGVVGFDQGGNIPTTYNWNFTVQRELPGQILVDVGYVGSSSNHNLYRINQNAIALGAAWLPQNQDPLNANPKFDGTTSNQPNFYRPYAGYTNTTDYGFGANSNYHSLQASAHRRFGRNFTFDMAYTWSKVMGTANDDGVNVNPFNTRVADYGPLFYDHTHMLVFNYVYNLPSVVKSKSAAGKVGGLIANNWQISGITTFMTGQPDNLSFSISGIGNLNERYTGSPDVGPRIVMNNSPSYPKDIYQWMTTAGLALPPVKGSAGFDSAPRSSAGQAMRTGTSPFSKTFQCPRKACGCSCEWRCSTPSTTPALTTSTAALSSTRRDKSSTLPELWAGPADASDSARSRERPIRAESNSRRSSTSKAE